MTRVSFQEYEFYLHFAYILLHCVSFFGIDVVVVFVGMEYLLQNSSMIKVGKLEYLLKSLWSNLLDIWIFDILVAN